MNKLTGKCRVQNSKNLVLVFAVVILNLFCALTFDICRFQFSIFHSAFAQDGDLEFTFDIASNTIALPKIFKPNIDLSGRGFHREASWPEGLAIDEVLNTWQQDIGFQGIYRLQYNLWEINEFAKNKDLQQKLLNNYEGIIKKISDAGGVVILDIFSTPAGLGKVLDKKSPPWDIKAFKEFIKGHIRNLSCNKRYNIWYEVWSAPDLDDFFLGRGQEYLNLYRAVAEIINELELETKIHIPLGGPSVSWWFHNLDGNTVVTPEKSLIYELIKFCYRYRLPLDFISWHGYSTDPKAEKGLTTYNKTVIALIRDWLSYFNFDRNTPLIVDEWNYDSGANLAWERREKSNICASYVLSRIKNMYEAGLDYQLYYCLEDFQGNKEGVVRNVGIFWFDSESVKYKGGPKATYNILRALANLGSNMMLPTPKVNDEFVDALAAKSQDTATMFIYNYIDPEIAMNYLSRNIASLTNADRKILLGLIKSSKLEKIMRRELEISGLRATNKVKALLKKAQELNDKGVKFRNLARNVKVGIKNLKENYLYQKYIIDLSCGFGCEFSPKEEKDISPTALYNETLTLNPYSVVIINLKKQKPKEPEALPVEGMEVAPSSPKAAVSEVNNAAEPAKASAETAAKPNEAQDSTLSSEGIK